MSAVLNTILGGIATAAQSFLSIIPQGQIGGITIDATLEERHVTSLQVTDHPVESGAQITDHSFKRPTEIILRCGWSNSSSGAVQGTITSLFSTGSLSLSDYVSSVYSQLTALQEARTVFSVSTSLLDYQNMLLVAIDLVRDKKTSQALMVTAVCREVIIVSTSTSSLPSAADMLNPANTAGIVNVGISNLVSGVPSSLGAASPVTWQIPFSAL